MSAKALRCSHGIMNEVASCTDRGPCWVMGSAEQARQSSVESNSREGEKITNTIGKKEATKNYCWLNICYANK